MNRVTRGFLLGAAGLAAALAVAAPAQAKPVKYVFMMIGDGMAMPQRNAAALYLANLDKEGMRPGVMPLTMDRLPVQGMATTYSANAVITDSAAAATALASGHKTNSGVINMDPAGKVKYQPLSKLAHDKGYNVGIVTSVSIDHATPAGYYAHAAGRSDYYSIGVQMLDSGFEYFAGGAVLEPTGKKKDKTSFYDLAKAKGYTVTQSREAFAALKPGAKKVFAENPVRADGNALPYAMDAGEESISLAEFTKKGIELLQNGQFFMMVEGGKIDWACHANDPGASIGDTVAFDSAVQVVYDFYKKHPQETLIIVTGDHETGGLTIGFAGTKYGNAIKTVEGQKASYIAFGKKFA
ncbi:MAG: alkaline phosphatase, partial [Rhodospirillaceae bacterium]